PGSRHLMKGKPGRNRFGQFEINQALPAEGTSTRETLLSAGEGVEVVGLRMGRNCATDGMPFTGGAQYYLVAAGVVRHVGRQLPPLSLILAQPGEEIARLKAGPQGAEILAMQLPAGSSRPGSQVGTLAERGLTSYEKQAGSVMEAR